MKKIRPDHVAIYVRWSTDDQTEGTTLQTQVEGCRHYALSQGWVPQDSLTFIDDGYSGGNLMRPALTKLRGLIKSRQIDCVVVLKVDRLSRNIVDAVELVLNEWKDSCFFKSAREPIDTGSDLGRVIFGILAMFADFERSQIKERTQSGKMRRIAEGKQLHGEPAFGYRPSGQKGQWEESPVEADLVRRMFNLAAEGTSANGICRRLNQEGIRTRSGAEWSIRGVLWMLHNRLYIGEAVYGKSQLKRITDPGDHRKTERIYKDQPTIWTATDAAPPLVHPDLFERVRIQLESNRVTRKEFGSRSLSSQHLLVGLARCRCGGTLVAKPHRTGANYFCHHYRAGRCAYGPGYIHQKKADEVVLAQFAAMYGTEAARADRLETAALRMTDDLCVLLSQKVSTERLLHQLDVQEARVMGAARTGEIDLKDLRDLRVGIQKDRADVDSRIRALTAQVEAAKGRVDRIQTIIQQLSAAERLDLLSTQQRRELLRSALAGPIIMFKAKGSDLIEIDIPWAYEAGDGS